LHEVCNRNEKFCQLKTANFYWLIQMELVTVIVAGHLHLLLRLFAVSVTDFVHQPCVSVDAVHSFIQVFRYLTWSGGCCVCTVYCYYVRSSTVKRRTVKLVR